MLHKEKKIGWIIKQIVYVLSSYERAKTDRRFLEAFEILRSKLDKNGQTVVEQPIRKLAKLSAFSEG